VIVFPLCLGIGLTQCEPMDRTATAAAGRCGFKSRLGASLNDVTGGWSSRGASLVPAAGRYGIA